MPIRGAIAHGEFNWGDYVFGRAVIDAHTLEMEQNWVGVSCQGTLPHLSNDQWPESLACYAVPKKGKLIQLLPAVRWEIPNVEDLFRSLTGKGLVKGNKILYWDFAEKLENTTKFRLYLKFAEEQKMHLSYFHGKLPMQVLELAFEEK